MYFLSVSLILMLVSFFSSMGADSATNSSSLTPILSNDDLVLVSSELVAQYKNDIEKLQVRLKSLNDNVLQPLMEKKGNLLANVREMVKRKAALLEISRAINATLNPTSGQKPMGFDLVCSVENGRSICQFNARKILDSNPATALNVDIAQLDQEIADAYKMLDVINPNITRADDDITRGNLELVKKMKIIELLPQLYHN